MVSKPNNWTKAVRSSHKNGELTKTKELNLEYWTKFKGYLDLNGSTLKARSPRPQPWLNFSLGRSHFYLEALASVMHGFIKVQLIITSDQAKDRFTVLKSEFEEIAVTEIDKNLVWDELEDSKRCTIYLIKECDVTDKSDWDNQFTWLFNQLEKMNTFFRPKTEKLK